jgi:hypothetical protein
MDEIRIEIPGGGIMRGFAYDAREPSQLVEESYEEVLPDGTILRGSSLRRAPRKNQTPPDAGE